MNSNQTTTILYVYQILFIMWSQSLPYTLQVIPYILFGKAITNSSATESTTHLKESGPILNGIDLQFTTPFRMVTLYLDELCIPIDHVHVNSQYDNIIVVKH